MLTRILRKDYHILRNLVPSCHQSVSNNLVNNSRCCRVYNISSGLDTFCFEYRGYHSSSKTIVRKFTFQFTKQHIDNVMKDDVDAGTSQLENSKPADHSDIAATDILQKREKKPRYTRAQKRERKEQQQSTQLSQQQQQHQQQQQATSQQNKVQHNRPQKKIKLSLQERVWKCAEKSFHTGSVMIDETSVDSLRNIKKDTLRIVTSCDLEKSKQQFPTQDSLRTIRIQPLLILDLNGILCHRIRQHQQQIDSYFPLRPSIGTIAGTPIIPRTDLQELIQYLDQTFLFSNMDISNP